MIQNNSLQQFVAKMFASSDKWTAPNAMAKLDQHSTIKLQAPIQRPKYAGKTLGTQFISTEKTHLLSDRTNLGNRFLRRAEIIYMYRTTTFFLPNPFVPLNMIWACKICSLLTIYRRRSQAISVNCTTLLSTRRNTLHERCGIPSIDVEPPPNKVCNIDTPGRTPL